MKGLAALVFIAAAASTLAARQAMTMTPGRYETTSEIAIPGGAAKMPARKDVVCVTADDLRDWSRNLVKTNQGTTCKLTDYKPTGRTLSFVRECTTSAGRTMTYAGDVTFDPPDAYRAVVKMGGSNEASPLRGATMTISARRLGACEK